MPSAASPGRSSSAGAAEGGWLGPALALAGLAAVLRLAVLAAGRHDLFVDEAQYWLWGQTIEWGYFSKPPLIGWAIRAVTDLAGSDAAFWVRAPAPVLHAVTALILGAVAARLAGPRAALWTVIVYLTMPLITVGSLLMTTDTLMFPFLAGALWAWVVACERRGWALAALAGALLGVGFLAKYAAIYHAGGALLAAALVPAARPGWAAALAGAAAFVVVISPNLAWNVGNGLITLQHTVDNVEWARDPADRLGLELDELAEFAGAQVFVFGPLFLPWLAWLGLTWRRRAPWVRALVAISLPIVLMLCAQASVSRAYANWAATAYLAGAVAVAATLPRRALVAGVAFGALVAVAIPLVVVAPGLAPEPVRAAVMDRYTGRVALSRAVLEAAEAEGLGTIVSENRDVLAGLFHEGRGAEVAVRAVPVEGRPPHHYAMRYPFEGGTPALYVGGAEPPPCAAERLGVLAPEGYWETRPRTLWRVPAGCWGA